MVWYGGVVMRKIFLTGLVLLVCLVLPAICWGQIGGLNAEFAGAGARPLAMGGSFLALADDSTAAEFNPAGIRILRRPEFAWQFTHTFDERDAFMPGSTFSQDIDQPGIRKGISNDWTTPSFVSYVHPGQKLTWALSQLTTIDIHQQYNDFGGNDPFSLDSNATNNAFGLTLSTDIKPRLHVGMTLRMNRFEYDHYDSITENLEFSDWAPSYNLGILWRKSKNWSFGAVYKAPQDIQTTGINTALPETWGTGVAWHPNDKVRVLADIDYINWSEFDSDRSDDYRRNDVTRYHLGGEYLLSLNEERAWFVRGGVMREDYNGAFYKGSYEPWQTNGIPEEDARNHLSAGIGLAKAKYQLDFAVDQTLSGNTVLILSMIHYF
jgi:long-subunit fatty acid transport protein